MSAQGTLYIRVYTSIAQIPVEGATVVVTERCGEGKRRLLSLQITDQNGTVRGIRLDTPPAEDSTVPGERQGERPYSRCDIWVEHPGYAMLQVENVQVFPDVETVQEMELIPLGEGENSLEKRGKRVVTPGNL